MAVKDTAQDPVDVGGSLFATDSVAEVGFELGYFAEYW